MKKVVYCIKDELVSFQTPWFLDQNERCDDLAKRIVKAEVNKGSFDHIIDDAYLYKLGEYDEFLGMFDNYLRPECVCSLKELKDVKNDVSEIV